MEINNITDSVAECTLEPSNSAENIETSESWAEQPWMPSSEQVTTYAHTPTVSRSPSPEAGHSSNSENIHPLVVSNANDTILTDIISELSDIQIQYPKNTANQNQSKPKKATTFNINRNNPLLLYSIFSNEILTLCHQIITTCHKIENYHFANSLTSQRRNRSHNFRPSPYNRKCFRCHRRGHIKKNCRTQLP